MRILFNCNTYYQLMVAVQLRLTTFKNDETILLFSDLSNGARKVVDNINKMRLFTETHLIEKYENNCAKKSTLDRLNVIKKLALQPTPSQYGKIDVLLYYNADEFYIYELFSSLLAANEYLQCVNFEENYFSYNIDQIIPFPTIVISNRIRELLNKDTLESRTQRIYCFKPKGYLGSLMPESIPSFDCDLDEIKKALRSIFDIRPEELKYPQKYIFFTSVYDFEGGEPVGEFELVNKVAELVGKDNLLVKIHPRDRRNIYAENGFNVDINSNIPWEAIQLNYDFSNHVFLALNSGSVLLVTTNMSNSPNVGYLYECLDFTNNEMAQKSKISANMLLEAMRGEIGFERIKILDSVEEIIQL